MNVFKGNTLYRIADPIENLSRIVYNIRDKGGGSGGKWIFQTNTRAN